MDEKKIIKNVYKAMRPVAKMARKRLKNTIMSDHQQDLRTERNRHAETIIRNHVIWSMGAGFIPILIADIFAVSALQLDMIRQLCRVYEVNFSETQGKAIVTSLTSSTLARIGASSVIKLIPGLGSFVGGAAVSVFAGASTYALGEVFKKHFESGGTILDFDPARLKKVYREKFEKGKKVAREWKKEHDASNKKAKSTGGVEEVKKTPIPKTPMPDAAPKTSAAAGPGTSAGAIQKLREIADLKASGIITEDEFERMKQRILEGF